MHLLHLVSGLLLGEEMKFLILCMSVSAAQIPSIILRYIPFRNEVTSKARNKLISIYAIMLLLNSILFGIITKKGLLTVGYYKNNLLLGCILLAVVNGFVIKDRYMEHIFVFGMTEILAIMFLTIISYTEVQIKSVDLEMLIIIHSISFCMLFLLLYPWLNKLMINTVTPFLKTDSREYWRNICLAPMAMFFAITFAFPMDEYIQTFRPMLCRILISVASLCLCRSVAYDYEMMRKREELSRTLNEQKEYFNALSNKVQEARKARHDLRHHLTVIHSCAEVGDIKQIKDYCEELLHSGISESFVPVSGNSAVDGIIYHYLQLCEKEKIPFDNYGVLKKINISDTDLCALLGNALENAYTASKKVKKERFIRLYFQEDMGYLAITVQNSYDGQLKIKQNKLLSLKRKNEPGIGLASLNDICKKYHGEMMIKYTETMFQVMCMLKVENNA